MADLTPKQAAFVEQYLIDLNATQAAIRAGYSARTANEQGARLLANVSVAQAVAEAKADRSAKLGLTAERVLEELAAIGFARLGDFARWGPEHFELKPSESVGDDAAAAPLDTRAVLEVKSKVTYTESESGSSTRREAGIKLHDKVATLKLLGQHIGMFSERHEHTGKDGGPIEVKPDQDAMTRVIEAAEKAAIRALYGARQEQGDADSTT